MLLPCVLLPIYWNFPKELTAGAYSDFLRERASWIEIFFENNIFVLRIVFDNIVIIMITVFWNYRGQDPSINVLPEFRTFRKIIVQKQICVPPFYFPKNNFQTISNQLSVSYALDLVSGNLNMKSVAFRKMHQKTFLRPRPIKYEYKFDNNIFFILRYYLSYIRFILIFYYKFCMFISGQRRI